MSAAGPFEQPKGGGVDARRQKILTERRERRTVVEGAEHVLKQKEIQRVRKEKKAKASAAKKAEREEARALPKLHVTLVRAANLPKMDLFGSCDAYVKIYIGSDSFKSRVVKNTYNPVFNQTHTFEVPPLVDVLELELFDWDMISADDFVGGCEIPLVLANQPGEVHTFPLVNPQMEQKMWKFVSGQRKKKGNGEVSIQLRWADNERDEAAIAADAAAAKAKAVARAQKSQQVTVGKGTAGQDRALAYQAQQEPMVMPPLERDLQKK